MLEFDRAFQHARFQLFCVAADLLIQLRVFDGDRGLGCKALQLSCVLRGKKTGRGTFQA